MFLDTDLDIDGNVALTINLRTPHDKFILFTSKPKKLTESDVLDAISNNRSAMAHIRVSHRRGHSLLEDGVYIVPVTLVATPVGTPEPIELETEIWIPDEAATQAQLTHKAAEPAPMQAQTAEAIAFLKSVHEMSLQTLGQIIKSANDALGKVAQAHSEALRSASANHSQAHQAIERMGSLPLRIFEQSSDQVEALVTLAQERATAKHGENAQQKDITSELKDLIGLINTMKGAFGNG